MTVEIRQGDARDVLPTLPAQSVHCVVTSPSYYGLRDYGCAGQIGLEATPQEYVAHLVEVFRAVRRILRDDGTCWIVIGDSYNSSPSNQQNGSMPRNSPLMDCRRGAFQAQGRRRREVPGLKTKDLMMIPHRVALALQADGWYMRQEIVWSKPAPMPESVTDRCTRSHEFIFMLAKGERYYYDQDAIREPHTTGLPIVAKGRSRNRHADDGPLGERAPDAWGALGYHSAGRNKRSVWTIGPQPLSDAHYAAFPEKLVEPMILAGTSEAGACPRCLAPYKRVVERGPLVEQRVNPGKPSHLTPQGYLRNGKSRCGVNAHVDDRGWQAGCSCDAGPPIPCTTLDPFLGSGTTALASKRLGRSCVGIELNESYCEMARRRVESVPYTLFSGAASTGGAAR